MSSNRRSSSSYDKERKDKYGRYDSKSSYNSSRKNHQNSVGNYRRKFDRKEERTEKRFDNKKNWIRKEDLRNKIGYSTRKNRPSQNFGRSDYEN